jgi:hypothetical protein
MFGGALQMYLGQPDTSARLDNVHRFMAGVYFSTGVISLWAALTIRQQGFLVYLFGTGRSSCRHWKAPVHQQSWPSQACSRMVGLSHPGASSSCRHCISTPCWHLKFSSMTAGGLSLQSRGQTKAGQACSLRALHRSRCLPLISSVRGHPRTTSEFRRYQVSRVLAAFNDDLIFAVKPSRSFSIHRM